MTMMLKVLIVSLMAFYCVLFSPIIDRSQARETHRHPSSLAGEISGLGEHVAFTSHILPQNDNMKESLTPTARKGLHIPPCVEPA